MQKLTWTLIFALFFVSCSQDQKQGSNSAATTKKAPSEKPQDQKQPEEQTTTEKWTLLFEQFEKADLLCEKSNERYCTSESTIAYQLFSLMTIAKTLSSQNIQQLQNDFNTFVDMKNRTLKPREEL